MSNVSLGNAPNRGVIEYTTKYTGIRVHITPIPVRALYAIQERLKETYPDPDVPIVAVDPDDKTKMQFAMGETEYENPNDPEYLIEAKRVESQRSRDSKRILYNQYVTFPDFDSEGLIEYLADKIAFLKEYGSELPDDDYEIAVYYCALNADDEMIIDGYITKLLPVTQEEVVNQLRIFRPALQRQIGSRHNKDRGSSNVQKG